MADVRVCATTTPPSGSSSSGTRAACSHRQDPQRRDGYPRRRGLTATAASIITGADLYNLYNRCADIITDFEATTNAKLNQLVRISVNDLPQF
jgi:hypothetical protein